MAKFVPARFRVRRNYGRITKITDIPNLIEIQKKSFERFLQKDVPHEKRENIGLQAVFNSVFPIRDYNDLATLEFVRYQLEKPKYDIEECRYRGMTYADPMKLVVRLVVWDRKDETGERRIRDVKEQEVYFGEMPLMGETGTFIINGTERVIVSQLHRSPGVFFEHDKGKSHTSGKLLYSARVIPYRGSWLDFEFDHKDRIFVRIDRRRKIPVTVLLKALGYSKEEILRYFYDTETVYIEARKKYSKRVDTNLLLGQRAVKDIKNPNTGEVIVKKNQKFTKLSIQKIIEAKLDRLPLDEKEVVGKVAAVDIVNPSTGEMLMRCNDEFDAENLETLRENGIEEVETLFIDNLNVGPYLRDTLVADKVGSPEEAIIEIYRRMRPGEPPTKETASKFIENLFFNSERYDLSKVGRLKLNYKFGGNEPLDNTVLTKHDILDVVKNLIDLKNGKGTVDDIDHLGNRRVRTVGELLENQYRIGLVRMERAVRERMTLQEVETLMPHDLINPKPVMAVIKEFFGSSQLSQFMDQTNPLSEVTHKRRLSALGPGGLTRERAGFEVRDVHPTHYGRICPIETPEGPNIGLISSLSTYARINDYGFVETPYRKVVKGKVTNDIAYMSALEEEKQTIAMANVPVDEKGNFLTQAVQARKGSEFVLVLPEEVTFMDVSPNQLVSVATALVPFLENDDANRALMGSNMQRQAVPLLKTKAPIVGTGMEKIVAKDSGVMVAARRGGVVENVEATRVVVKPEGESHDAHDLVAPDTYHLRKFQRSNQNTCINQKPIVKAGDRVKAGDVIADGPATEMGELAQGRDVLVAFMPWGGYNFEDSILISERLVKDDGFTSIHIEEVEAAARDTKLGKEEITRDIPNVGEEAMGNLDESGIIRIGAEVKPGDILVGKVTPKGETQLSPEEKLLRAIFGEKAGDVRDTSLRVQPGVNGTVIAVRIFQRRGVDKDPRARDIEEEERQKLMKDQLEEIKIIKQAVSKRILRLISGRTLGVRITDERGKVLAQKGREVTEEVFGKIPEDRWADIDISVEPQIHEKIVRILENMGEQIDLVRMVFNEKLGRLKRGDELPPGVIKQVKVYVATKRKISVGDKMAGRHGNKGVVSRILPVEDMPYMQDGTPVDMVLNPLGVPSRMNVGQILETHLGWACKGLGQKIWQMYRENYASETIRRELKKMYKTHAIDAFLDSLSDRDLGEFIKDVRDGICVSSPVFDGASEAEIKDALSRAGLPVSGQAILFDGRAGEPFDSDVTVGIMYMMKLHHLVDDKVHARSIGPYSLVTQQPLGGKAQFGGQRLGEMEVWALQAYGAAYTLQEFLTVKSDDVLGRAKMYETIVKGENALDSGVPESFNVLIKELQSLVLDVELIEEEKAVG